MRIVKRLQRRFLEATVAASVALGFARLALAQQVINVPENQPINLSIQIGGKNVVNGLADYIGVLYNYLTAAAFLIAAALITVGGFQWALAAGSPKMIASAKRRVTNALIGLILIVGSYVLLLSINPAFVNPKLPPIQKIPQAPSYAGGFCPDAIATQNDCGKVVKNQPTQGVDCIGKKCSTGTCVQSGSGYSCIVVQCPSSCAQITNSGTNWKQLCASTACIIQIPGLCFVDVTGKCADRPKEGESCDNSRGRVCVPTATCEALVCKGANKNKADGTACTNDNQCASGVCNMLSPDASGQGKCAPTGGYANNGQPCTTSGTDPSGELFCGMGFHCVKSSESDANGVCSDGSTDTACNDLYICADPTNTCQASGGGAVKTCQPAS